jgi:hypothetical protein
VQAPPYSLGMTHASPVCIAHRHEEILADPPTPAGYLILGAFERCPPASLGLPDKSSRAPPYDWPKALMGAKITPDN